MALNPLAPVTDYQSMLNRIFWFTSAAALGAIGLLGAHVPMIETALARIDFDLDSGEGTFLPIPAGYLLPALAVGLLVRVYRVHGQISHWLGISERFDVDVIIKELARRSGIAVESVPDHQWVDHRHDIMQRAFYRFASSRAPQIDEHLIHQALDQWSWFWIGLDAAVVYAIAGFGLIACQAYTVGALTLGGALVGAAVGLPMIRRQCQRYAIAQVKSIVADPTRAAEVRQAFAWLAATHDRLERSA